MGGMALITTAPFIHIIHPGLPTAGKTEEIDDPERNVASLRTLLKVNL